MKHCSRCLFFACLVLCGCSVSTAWHGRHGPDIKGITPGYPRSDVERELGNPVSSAPNMFGGKSDVYHYLTDAEAQPGRAFAYALFDVLSLGLWELVARPEPKELEVEYDAGEKVVSVRKLSR